MTRITDYTLFSRYRSGSEGSVAVLPVGKVFAELFSKSDPFSFENETDR